jgi:hypothetical protein
MKLNLLTGLAGLVLMCPPTVGAQPANACDLNGNGTVDNDDVQVAIRMALGTTPCTATVMDAGLCNVVLVQRVTNAAHGAQCVTTPPHKVSLSWTASTSTNVAGYNVYRGTTSGGPYTKLNSRPLSATAYTDFAVQPGGTYYYVTTSVNSAGNESPYFNEV